jgi:glucosamine-6-phosphate deaminase
MLDVEGFKIFIEDNYDSMSIRAADIVTDMLKNMPRAAYGFATGATPEGFYKLLIERYNQGLLDFSKIVSFNLDEYYFIAKNSKHSYHYYMNKHLFDHVNIDKKNINLPDPEANDIALECKHYEDKIKKVGGLELQILGIGSNCHIGFNEPSEVFTKSTGVINLKASTIRSNARFFTSEKDVPKQAVSMGIKTIFKANKILLLASGKHKAWAIRETIFGDIKPENPSSVLQLHNDVTLVLDKQAASLII